jgi:hypothetical protein
MPYLRKTLEGFVPQVQKRNRDTIIAIAGILVALIAGLITLPAKGAGESP